MLATQLPSNKVLFGTIAFVVAVSQCFSGTLIDQADSLYALRDVGFNPVRMVASSANVDKAISLYQQAIRVSSGAGKEDAIWKLMRAYYFEGMYTTSDPDKKIGFFDQGKEVGAQGLREYPESQIIHTGMAILWGAWAQESSAIRVMSSGAVDKIRYHCERVMELDQGDCRAIAMRIYGRLHFKAPRIPFVLGWTSKAESVRLLEQAYRLAPDDLFAKQYLAEALYARGEKDRALALMEEILRTDHIVIGVVEDAFNKCKARVILEKWHMYAERNRGEYDAQ